MTVESVPGYQLTCRRLMIKLSASLNYFTLAGIPSPAFFGGERFRLLTPKIYNTFTREKMIDQTNVLR